MVSRSAPLWQRAPLRLRHGHRALYCLDRRYPPHPRDDSVPAAALPDLSVSYFVQLMPPVASISASWVTASAAPGAIRPFWLVSVTTKRSVFESPMFRKAIRLPSGDHTGKRA